MILTLILDLRGFSIPPENKINQLLTPRNAEDDKNLHIPSGVWFPKIEMIVENAEPGYSCNH